MRKIISLALIATMTTLMTYFGMVAFGMEPDFAALVISTIALALGVILAVFIRSDFDAIAMLFTAFVVGFSVLTAVDGTIKSLVAVTVLIVFASLAVRPFVEGCMGYWKVILVYLIEAVIIATPVWLLLRGGS